MGFAIAAGSQGLGLGAWGLAGEGQGMGPAWGPGAWVGYLRRGGAFLDYHEGTIRETYGHHMATSKPQIGSARAYRVSRTDHGGWTLI